MFDFLGRFLCFSRGVSVPIPSDEVTRAAVKSAWHAAHRRARINAEQDQLQEFDKNCRAQEHLADLLGELPEPALPQPRERVMS